MAKCFVFSVFQDKITHGFYKIVYLLEVGVTESYIKITFCSKIHCDQFDKKLNQILLYFNKWILNASSKDKPYSPLWWQICTVYYEIWGLKYIIGIISI